MIAATTTRLRCSGTRCGSGSNSSDAFQWYATVREQQAILQYVDLTTTMTTLEW